MWQRLIPQMACSTVTRTLLMIWLMPQFIQPQYALAWQLGVLLTATVAIDLVVLSPYAFFALRGARHLRASGTMRWLE